MMKETSYKVTTIFKLFISALKGEKTDYTSGCINRAIVLLSIPMIAEMLLESAFALVDILFVTQVSVNAVATVGLTESVLMIIYSIAVGLSMAVTAIIARRVGEKNFKKANNAAFQVILLAIVIGIALGVPGFIFAEDVLRLMGGDETLIAEGVKYTKIMYAGNLSIILIFLINAIFRGAGNAAIAMRSLWLANGLNILLDPLFIFGWGPVPAFGVEGAAIATTTGRTIGVFYQLFHLLNGRAIVRIAWENAIVKWQTIREMLVVSFGGIFQFLVESASWIFLVRVIANFGSEALAGYTIAFRIIVFTLLPSWGMANAAATLVGQNLGAGQPGRAETSAWRAALWNTVFLFIVSIVFFAFANPIFSIFVATEPVAEIGIQALRIICLGYVFYAYGMVIGQAFNGSGDTYTPLIIGLVVFWVIQIPLAYVLSIVYDWGPTGVFFCIALCHSLYALVAIFIFKKGGWKQVKI